MIATCHICNSQEPTVIANNSELVVTNAPRTVSRIGRSCTLAYWTLIVMRIQG